MSLLDVLYAHEEGIPLKSDEHELVEYRLLSWGEIYRRIPGDRKHSVTGRIVLPDLPFKLFSTTAPHARPPQILTLEFIAPVIKKSSSLSGIFPNDIAEEFAAVISLFTRRRVFAQKLVRSDGNPIEEAHASYMMSPPQEPQSPKELDPKRFSAFLGALRQMNRKDAEAVLLAARLYHSAIGMLYAEPEFSYLFLVTCLEAISSRVNASFRPRPPDEYLSARRPGWKGFRESLPDDKRQKFASFLLKGEHFTFRKMAKFIDDNLPETFWSECVDDAKPDYVCGMIVSGPNGLGREEFTRSETKLNHYERMTKKNLRKTLRAVYDARSSLLHEGIRLPPTIVVGHFTRIPPEAYIESLVQAAQGRTCFEIPPLLTFERLVARSIVNYVEQHHEANSQCV